MNNDRPETPEDLPRGLSAVPDIGDEGVTPVDLDAEEGEVGEEVVDEVFAVLEAQNAALVNQLGILGKGINPLMLLKIQMDTLIDFTFGEDEARKHYETACSMRLNETLKMTLAKLVGADIEG